MGRILSNRAVAREFTGACNVQDRIAGPTIAIGVKITEALIRVDIGFEICEVHVVVAMLQQRIMYRSKDTRLVAAEVADEIISSAVRIWGSFS
jgi:hypothetical protein